MKTIPRIKVGICIAYDWEMLKTALPIIYTEVDDICLSLDINRQTWAGNKFEFEEQAFFNYVKEIDIDKKIIVYEDDFYLNKTSTMKNEVYQRNKIAEKLGKENSWHIQIDVDEYFVDFKRLTTFLRNNYFRKDVNICLPFYILFKQIDNLNLFVKGNMEWVPVVSNNPYYEFGRRNGYFNYKFESPIIHQSWARQEHEIQQKISNWENNKDFDVQAFFEKWKSLNGHNYKKLLDFHPISGNAWHELVPIEGNTIVELIQNNKNSFDKLKTYSPFKIKLQNSRIISKLVQILKIKW